MLGVLSYKQARGLARANYQYQTARKLGHAPSSALAGAVAAYMLETAEPRDKAERAVAAFLALEAEIPGGVV